MVILFLLITGIGNATVLDDCDSCDECNETINSASPGDTVYLKTDIPDHQGTCIEFDNKGGITFDCQGKSIVGDSEGFDRGIFLNRGSGNTIKNCIISQFDYGIWLSQSNNNTLINNTANDNDNDGIYLSSSHNNTFINNTANSNEYGMKFVSSHKNTLLDNTANSNEYGMKLVSSHKNTLLDNTINSNTKYGIWLHKSDNNILNLNHVCSNPSDFYLTDSDDNSGDNNMCDNTENWDDLDPDTEGCKYLCGSRRCSDFDLNDDNWVDMGDLFAITKSWYWGCDGDCGDGFEDFDLNDDNAVDMGDLFAVTKSGYWGEECI